MSVLPVQAEPSSASHFAPPSGNLANAGTVVATANESKHKIFRPTYAVGRKDIFYKPKAIFFKDLAHISGGERVRISF
jgi:hypothetical protein